MEDLLAAVKKNEWRGKCVPPVSTAAAEPDAESPTIPLAPPRLTTAWCMLEDPMMSIAGESYKTQEVRDRSFALQEEAVANLRGNRKLTKAKMGDALAAVKPTVIQTKVVAGVLYGLKQIQTVCYDEEKKTLWTVPEDLRVWSRSRPTLWVDARCETMLRAESVPSLGLWLSQKEREGWTIPWPDAEGTLEEVKQQMRGQPGEPQGKVKKEVWARALGRLQAVEALGI